MSLTEKIGAEFLRILTGWAAPDGHAVTAEFVESANDYYDANMAMDEAFLNCGEPSPADYLESQTVIDMWNNAWQHATKLAREKAHA